MSLILPEPHKPGEAGRRNNVGPLARAGTIGLHLVSGMIAGGGIGYFLASWLGSGWWFIIFFVLGFISGVLNTVRDIRKLLREQEEGAVSHERHTPED